MAEGCQVTAKCGWNLAHPCGLHCQHSERMKFWPFLMITFPSLTPAQQDAEYLRSTWQKWKSVMLAWLLLVGEGWSYRFFCVFWLGKSHYSSKFSVFCLAVMPHLCLLARESRLLDIFMVCAHLHLWFAGSFSFKFRIFERNENQGTHRRVIPQVLWSLPPFDQLVFFPPFRVFLHLFIYNF